jgi:AcrR family transcriptional regulator
MSPRQAKGVKGRVGDDPATALRNHLIDVAEHLLATRPVSSITTRGIARAGEVSDGVLYNYFANKNDLLVAALVRRFSAIVANFDADLPRPGTATIAENLTTYAHASLGQFAEALPLVAALITEPLLLHQFFKEIHSEAFGPQLIFQRLGDYLKGEQGLGRLPDVDVEAATDLLIGSTALLALSHSLRGISPEDLAARIPALVGTLMRGITAPAKP